MRRKQDPRGVVVLWLLGVAGCGDGVDSGPTGHSLPAARSLVAVEASALLAAGVFSGRVVDSLTGEPIAGARLQAGDAVVESEANGLFALPSGLSGILPFRVEAPGHFVRETRVQVGSIAPVEIDLLPEGKKFDLNFFDHVYRELGEDGSHRWATEPAFQILERVLDCVETDSQGYCNVFQATDEPVAELFVSLSQQVVLNDASPYTGGRVMGASATSVEVAPGTRIVRSDAWVRDTVRFALVRLPNESSWASMWYYRGSGSLYSGLVMINKHHKSSRGVYSHELAHTLGYYHPRGGWEVPLRSIMRYGHGEGPEANDLLHGAILYRRPSGSRTPDRDPEDFVLNALRGHATEAGELVERIVN